MVFVKVVFQFFLSRIGVLVFLILFAFRTFGLDPIVVPQNKSSDSPKLLLAALIKHPKYLACASDLGNFLSRLSGDDFSQLKGMQSKVDTPKLLGIFKKGLEGLSGQKNSQNPRSVVNDKRVYAFISHGAFRCKLLIDLELDMDQIKGGLDPATSAETVMVTGKGEIIEAAMIGASRDIDGKEVHIDPSKALTLIKRQGIALGIVIGDVEAIRILEEFKKTQSSAPATAPMAPGQKSAI